MDAGVAGRDRGEAEEIEVIADRLDRQVEEILHRRYTRAGERVGKLLPWKIARIRRPAWCLWAASLNKRIEDPDLGVSVDVRRLPDRFLVDAGLQHEQGGYVCEYLEPIVVSPRPTEEEVLELLELLEVFITKLDPIIDNALSPSAGTALADGRQCGQESSPPRG